MDLWDVTKLLARRWYVSVPLLLVTLACTLWIGVTTEPDYKDTSHVTLLPPTVLRGIQAGTTQNVNPWTVDSLIAAVITRLNSKAQHDALQADGLSGIWEADTDLQFRELISIEVTARSEEQARATTARLQQIVTEEVAKQQARYKLKPGEEITTIPFDSGENVVPSRSKLVRAMIVVLGVGGVITIAIVIALDALLRRRSSRLTSSGRARPAQLLVRQRIDEPTAPITRVPEPRGAEQPPVSVPISIRTLSQPTSKAAKPANGTNGSGEETTVIATGIGKNGSGSTTQAVELPPEAVKSLVVDQFAVQEDATVVLPLSNPPWGSKAGKSDSKNSDNGN
jgi:hypothetical protein